MKLQAILVMALLQLILPGRVSSQDHPRKLSLDLYLDLQEVSEPQISPDGSRVVYQREWIDKVNDRWDSALWMVNSDGSADRFLLKGSSAQWSPDGSRIAYIAPDDHGHPQIFVRRLADAESTQLTRVENAPSNPRWAPDGNSIAFTMLVPRKPSSEWDIDLPAKPAGANWIEDPVIIERLVYRRDRMGYLPDGHFQVFLVSVTGGTPRQLTFGETEHGGGPDLDGNLSWTPDGKEILFSSLNTQDWEYPWKGSEVYALRVADGSIRQLTNRNGPDHNAEVSPDGRWVAYAGYDWTNDSYIASDLYVMSIDGSGHRLLTSSLDRSLYSSPYGAPSRNFWWAPDSSGLYFNLDDRGTRNLYFVSLEGKAAPVTSGNHMLTVASMSAQGHVAAVATSPLKPLDVVYFELKKPELKQITFVNQGLLRGISLGAVEEFWVSSVDNLRVQGWIVKPPDFEPGKKYPLILAIHGGPHAMYSVGFNLAWQLHAASGYILVYANPRGSTGYGSTFANAINNAYPGKDYDDLMKVVDEVLARGYVDDRNLFVYGCSGGGVLTAWIVGHTNRFAAASANCPVTNWVSLLGTTDGVSFYWNFKKLPWEDPSEHLARSPLTYVGSVTTPTMLMTGELDLNTPMEQSEQFYRALKLRGIPTALVRVREEGHGTTSRPSNFMRTQLYLHRWFQRFSSTKQPRR